MATIRDIVNATGYSVATVSRALRANTRVQVAEEARTRVLEAARRLGYQPNRLASCLKQGIGPSLGFFLPHYNQEEVLWLLHGMMSAANKEGFAYNTFFDFTGDSLLKFLRHSEQSRAIGIATTLPPSLKFSPVPRLLHHLTRHGTTTVVMNSPLPDGMSLPHLEIDYRHGGALAARHLLETGCRHFIAEGSTVGYQFGGRLGGFQWQLEEAGHALSSVYLGPKDELTSAKAEVLLRMLLDAPKPVGLFIPSDFRALWFIEEMHRRSLGTLLGNEVRLIGFGDLALARHTHPRLTTVSNPMEDLGELAVGMLFNQILGGNRPIDLDRLKPTLIIRETA
jgi:DNA-binding LacI/PurR family transcriptional regulator